MKKVRLENDIMNDGKHICKWRGLWHFRCGSAFDFFHLYFCPYNRHMIRSTSQRNAFIMIHTKETAREHTQHKNSMKTRRWIRGKLERIRRRTPKCGFLSLKNCGNCLIAEQKKEEKAVANQLSFVNTHSWAANIHAHSCQWFYRLSFFVPYFFYPLRQKCHTSNHIFLMYFWRKKTTTEHYLIKWILVGLKWSFPCAPRVNRNVTLKSHYFAVSP